jgi:hypothetical protein
MKIRRRRSCQKPKYTSPQSQLVITALLVSIEVIINAIWLIHDKPAVAYVYPTREENVLICLGSDNTSYLVGLIYPSILIGEFASHTTISGITSYYFTNKSIFPTFLLSIRIISLSLNKSYLLVYFLKAFAPYMPSKLVNAPKVSMKLDI